MTPPIEDSRRCGWMADQPDGQTCGDRAAVAVQVQVFDALEDLSNKRLAGLMLCAQHADHPGLET